MGHGVAYAVFDQAGGQVEGVCGVVVEGLQWLQGQCFAVDAAAEADVFAAPLQEVIIVVFSGGYVFAECYGDGLVYGHVGCFVVWFYVFYDRRGVVFEYGVE
ncbi:MAG: hypothetical protein A4E55_01221 [Pelotomaculum sp. PtaU1.Bin035]|nr:MAG: hypothetical protein A4E55_01221 [Pelotomaculum sp. PtaU1.Bin035]